MKSRQERVEQLLSDLERGYDRMAQKFSDTRSFFWRDLGFISDYVKKGDRILDFGCGNGRLFDFLGNREVEYFGVDVSKNLIEIAKNKYPEIEDNFFKITSQGSLPFPADFFNVIFSIAVFHHFPPEYAQKKAEELFRATKPGGRVVVTAWNLWQGKNLRKIINPQIIFKKIFKLGEEGKIGFREARINFSDNKGKIFSRYHYAYTPKTLAGIFEKAGFKIEKSEIIGQKNIFFLGRK